jgi:hypothetical protein
MKWPNILTIPNMRYYIRMWEPQKNRCELGCSGIVGTVPDPLLAPVVRNIRIVLSKMFSIIFFCNQDNKKHNINKE